MYFSYTFVFALFYVFFSPQLFLFVCCLRAGNWWLIRQQWVMLHWRQLLWRRLLSLRHNESVFQRRCISLNDHINLDWLRLFCTFDIRRSLPLTHQIQLIHYRLSFTQVSAVYKLTSLLLTIISMSFLSLFAAREFSYSFRRIKVKAFYF